MTAQSAIENSWQNMAADRDTEGPSSRLPILLQYWNALWRRRLLVIAIFAVCLLGGAVLTALSAPQYTASAEIEISREQDRVTNVDGLQSDRAGQTQEFYYTQYELLKSRSLAERVARDLGLVRSAEFFAAHGEELEADNGGNAAQMRVNASEIGTREKRVVELLETHIGIAPLRGSALVTISYESGDPAMSARIANAWAEQFIAASLDRRFASTAQARSFLEGRLADLRERLNESEQELVSYAVNENLIRLAPGQSANEDTRTLTEIDLAELNRQLAQATVNRIEAQGNIRALSSQRENMQTVESAALNSLVEQRAAVASELAALLVQFEPEYPPAQALQRRIGSIDQAIANERARITRANNASLTSASAQENALRERVDRLVGSLVDEKRNGIRYGILQREVDTNRQLYEGLLQRYKEIGVAGVGANNISVVDRATVPSIPSSPNLLVNLVLALLAAGAISAGLILVLENLDQGIRDPSTIQSSFGIPLLGIVPEAVDDDVKSDISDRKSEVSEAYATIQTNLNFATDHGFPTVCMMTSTAKAEGKSTSALALAQGIARMGRQVILIDADMRLPTLDALIGKRGTAGLSNYLAGENDVDAMLHRHEDGGFAILTSGPKPPSTPELLGSKRLEQLVRTLRSKFDHVIFDAPPMLGLADALQISAVTEGVIYVAEAEREPVRTIASTIDRLKQSNAKIFGLILTKYSARRSGYGYGYGYDYSYRYGDLDTDDGDAELEDVKA